MKKYLLLTFLFLIILNAQSQSIIFTPFGSQCAGNTNLDLDDYVNLNNGKWELLSFDSMRSGNQYNAAVANMMDSTGITLLITGRYHWKYSNWNGGSPLEDSIFMTISSVPNFVSVRNPATKCFDEGQFDLSAQAPVGCGIDTNILNNGKVWYKMINSNRDTMIDGGDSSQPHWYYTQNFYKSGNGTIPSPPIDKIRLVAQINGCIDSIEIEVRINPNPVVILQDLYRCQDAGSFRVNDLLLKVPFNPATGVTWEIDSAPAGVSNAEKALILKDRGNIFFPEYWFNPMNTMMPVDHPLNANRLGCYKLKFTYENPITACRTTDYCYVCIEAIPQVDLTPFDKFCFSDGDIALDDYVNLTRGKWELISFNGNFGPGTAQYQNALQRFKGSNVINVYDSMGFGGTYNLRYVNTETGCPVKDSVDLIVNSKPQLQVNSLDELCYNSGKKSLLPLVEVPFLNVFKNGAAGTGWFGNGVMNDSLNPSLIKGTPFKTNTQVYAKYVNPITLCSNTDSFSVLVEQEYSFDTVIQQNNNILRVNDGLSFYQWVDCDQNFQRISGATNQSFSPSKDGNYAVILSRGKCNKDTSFCFAFQKVGTSSLQQSAIQIYPNPFSDGFRIRNSNKDLTITSAILYDALGKKVQKFNSMELQKELIIDLPAGLYHLHIETNQGMVYKKLSK